MSNKIISVMQPYFLPYIGYWQLIAIADVFVLLDDVNFIVRGYINRNNILVNGRAYLFSMPVAGASQNRLIRDTKLNFSSAARKKLLKTIAVSYKKAPQFPVVFPLLESIIYYPENDLTKFIQQSLVLVSGYLGLNTRFILSSSMEKGEPQNAQDRIIDICLKIGGETYINPPGGWSLYDPDEFRRSGLALRFLRPGAISYTQFHHDFVPNLSIIDVLMFNTTGRISHYLRKYDLVEKDQVGPIKAGQTPEAGLIENGPEVEF